MSFQSFAVNFLSSFKVGMALLGVLLSSCGPTESVDDSRIYRAWDPQNNPQNFGSVGLKKFDELPLSGELDRKPWSGYFWPANKGGIAQRWQASNDKFPWQYRSPGLNEIRGMSEQEIDKLSPSEKYDIFMGDYSYALTRFEAERTDQNNPSWWGLCNGRSSAALIHKEPTARAVTNMDGIRIRFSSADLKALLSLAHEKVDRDLVRWRYIGFRCNQSVSSEDEDLRCDDTNAGSFHLALVHQINVLREGFVMDRTRDTEVWNRPVYAYRSEVLGEQGPSERAAPGTVRELKLRTEVDVADMINPRQQAQGAVPKTKTYTYRYTIELDEFGRIIGGEWLTWQRPDFLWKATFTDPKLFMSGRFEGLKSLL